MYNSGKTVSDLDIGSGQGTNNVFAGVMRRLSMKIAKIQNVHTDTNAVDLEWLWPVRGGASNIQLGRAGAGLRSGVHYMPEVGSIVLVGYAFNKLVILSYLLPSDYASMLAGTPDAQGNPTRLRQLDTGEISINSSENAEVYLNDQVNILDPNGNNITIEPDDNSINFDSMILYSDNEAGQITMGPTTRNGSIITSDGLPILSNPGGNALTELNIVVEQYSNGTIFDGTQNNNLANITVGTLVDANGLQVINQASNNIITNVDYATSSITKPQIANANFKVDDEGNFNINDGNQLLPTDVPAVPVPLLNVVTGNTFIAQCQQRVAREGDRVVIPVGIPTTSLEAHPDLANKATFNIEQMQQIVSSILTPMGPCIGFVPAAPDMRLVGMITQGSDSFFAGSLDKTAEAQETADNTL